MICPGCKRNGTLRELFEGLPLCGDCLRLVIRAGQKSACLPDAHWLLVDRALAAYGTFEAAQIRADLRNQMEHQ